MAEISIDNLWFGYRPGRWAVEGATAKVGPGIHLLLGPNGAGKTTLMQLLCGILQPRMGSVTVDGMDVAKHSPAAMADVFFLGEDTHFPLATIQSMAQLHAPFYPNFSVEQLQSNLQAFGMDGTERLSAMSLGARKRANIAYALALNTGSLMLDEPTNGLDIQWKKAFNKVLAANCADDKTIIVATHTVHEMQPLFDGLLFLRNGHLDLVADMYDLSRRVAFVTSPRPIEDAIYAEPDLAGFRSIIANDGGEIESQVDLVLLYEALMANNPRLLSILLNNE